MRVTLDIPDEIHAWLKARARLEGTTMRAIILRGIEKLLRANKVTVEGKTKPYIESKVKGAVLLG